MRHGQQHALVRMEWGLRGAEAIAPGAGVVVVVDVLRFTTAVTVAVEAGASVYPFPWADESAKEFARRHDAKLAAGGLDATKPGGGGSDEALTLSPAAIRAATGLTRLVLPSPNGSALAHALVGAGPRVVGGSLRNRTAVARWIADELIRTGGQPIAVIAAGERWDDGSLRPAVEDLWGAGAIIAALSDFGVGDQSPEAWAAEASFRGVEEGIAAELADCGSGQELTLKGFSDDVAIAAELDASECVPVLTGERFLNAR
jgi:2-phosphosulfolactate phosphatase